MVGRSVTGNPIVSTSRAHRLLFKAYQVGGQDVQCRVLTGILKAYFTEQKNIALIPVLAEIAEGTELMSKEEAVQFLTSDELKEDVQKMAADAKTVGVKGVPYTFIDGKWVISGAQKAETYIKVCLPSPFGLIRLSLPCGFAPAL
jgi:predicted DsbA family dithiol-disulfide isomerase